MKARSCRYMPPERTYDWDEPRSMPYYQRGARSYFNGGLRTSTEETPVDSDKPEACGRLKPLRSFLARLGLLR